MDARKGMNVLVEIVQLGQSGMGMLKAGQGETQCGGIHLGS